MIERVYKFLISTALTIMVAVFWAIVIGAALLATNHDTERTLAIGSAICAGLLTFANIPLTLLMIRAWRA